VDPGEVTDDSKNIQEPQDDDNDHNGIQNRFYGSRHGDEAVDDPKSHTDHNQD
jgi:hypothetical protein